MPVTPKHEIALPERDRLATVRERHGVRLLLLHGSHVTGRVHAKSDVDLAVLLDDPQAGTVFELFGDLQSLFPSRHVDVVVLNTADPLLAWQVCRTARLIAGSRADFAERRRYAWRRYVEYRPFLELEAQAVKARLAVLRNAG